MKIGQVKVPEMALDGMMAYAGIQFDKHATTPGDHYHSGNPDGLPGGLMIGLHAVSAVGTWCVAGNGKQTVEDQKKLAFSGISEAVKAGGFAMQIAPSLGMLGAGVIAIGTLGDLCSGWAGDSVRSFQENRQAHKAQGPQGCNGPED